MRSCDAAAEAFERGRGEQERREIRVGCGSLDEFFEAAQPMVLVVGKALGARLAPRERQGTGIGEEIVGIQV